MGSSRDLRFGLYEPEAPRGPHPNGKAEDPRGQSNALHFSSKSSFDMQSEAKPQ